MKIIETPQGKIEIYPFDVGKPEPKGLETTALVLSPEKFDELLDTMEDFRRDNKNFKRTRIGGFFI